MRLLASEIDIVIPAVPVNYWPWIGALVAVMLLGCAWWLATRVARKSPNNRSQRRA